MRRFLLISMLGFVALAASCGEAPHQSTEQAAKPAAPAYPPEVDQAAQNLFGLETDVLAYGDLALNGKKQALVVNRVKKTPEGMVPGTLVVRAAIIEEDAGTWKEVFLCDQHLKNPSGYLGGIPISPVNGWRLQYDRDATKGLEMYFTPLEKPAGGYVETIGVRWNPEVKRYQSLDRSYKNFLTEVSTLDPVDGMPDNQ